MAASIYNPVRETAQFFRDMRDGSRRQANVVFALIFKEFKNRAGRDARLGMLWIVIDPITAVIVMALFWYLMGRVTIAGVNTTLFLAVGYAPFSIVMKGLSSIPRSLKSNRMFYNYQQVKPFDSVLAEFILEISLSLIGEVLLFTALWWFLDLTINFENIMPLLALMVLAAIISFGFSLAVATYGTLYDWFAKAVTLLTRPLFFVTPIFYAPNSLPDQARYLLSWNPMTHVIEYARHYALGLKLIPEVNISYPVLFGVCVVFFGLLSYYPNRLRFLKT
jgi:capsular polysaccharide transport system permease protein